jgi:hypothetical protein
VTTDPQADATSAAFVAYLAAHLDRYSSREGEPDSVSGPLSEPDAELDEDQTTDEEQDAELDADLDLDSDLDPISAARFEGIRAALSDPSAWSEPPDLRSSILARVRAQAENGTAPTEAPEPVAEIQAPEPEADVVPDEEPRLATVTPLRPRWQRLAVALPLTAAASVLITLTVLGVQALLRPGPDEVFTALGGDGLRVEVTVTSQPSGFEITLAAEDLPAAPAGSYYAAWLRRGPGPGDGGPIGTFHGRRVGEPVELWSGVDPSEYRTFSVTLQRDGEPPLPNAPSARRVLLGTIGG